MMGEAPKSKALFYYFKLGDYTKAASAPSGRTFRCWLRAAVGGDRQYPIKTA